MKIDNVSRDLVAKDSGENLTKHQDSPLSFVQIMEGGAPSDIWNRPSKYALPKDERPICDQTPFQQLEQKITEQAISQVQGRMTPEEKHALNEDARSFAIKMELYEKEMERERLMLFFRRPEDWPKPPQKPESIVKYEKAIDNEIGKIVSGKNGLPNLSICVEEYSSKLPKPANSVNMPNLDSGKSRRPIGNSGF